MTENKKTTYEEERDRWAKEDVLQLAHHFHRFTDTKQFKRVGKFSIQPDDLEVLNKNLKDVSKMTICLALEERDIHKQTFFPILKVTYFENDEDYYKLIPAQAGSVDILQKEAVGTNSAEVPKIFKDMIHSNWNGIEFNLIDDLFIANKEGAPVRVLEYIIGTNVIETVIKKLNNIVGVTFYMGVDMNKFQNREAISFTPVLGFKYTKTPALQAKFAIYEALEFGPFSALQNDFGEVFIEYSRPCPPTCG